jgi:hypothetical protein
MYVDSTYIVLSNPLLLPLLLESNVIRMTSLERGDEGGYGSVWDRVHLVMGASISWTPIKSRTVLTLRVTSMMTLYVCFSCMCIVKLLFWPENYLRNLSSFVSCELHVR